MAEFFTKISRLIRWRRREIAAVLAALGVLLTVQSIKAPTDATVTVVTASKHLVGGAKFTSEEVKETKIPKSAVPEQAIKSLGELDGHQLASAVTKGTVLTQADLLGSKAALPPGHQLVPIRIVDEDIWHLLSVGDSINVIAPDQTVLGERLRVIALPDSKENTARSGRLVVVSADMKTATQLASISATENLNITFN